MKKLLLFCLLVLLVACGNDSDSSPDLSGAGQGGSLAKFTIAKNQVLVLTDFSVKQYDILNNGSLAFKNESFISDDLETIFPYGDNILIGSSSAVYFLGFNANDELELKGEFIHFTACDPVVASGTLAYSTLRSTGCRFDSQEVIDVIDFSDINNPFRVNSIPSESPFGLAIAGDYLFVCEKGGISMFLRGNDGGLVSVGFFEIDGRLPIDIIPQDGFLIVRTDNGIYNVTYDPSGQMTILGSVRIAVG